MGLNKFAKNVNSQNGEDGILKEIFQRLKIKGGQFCEFGAWDGIYLSNTFSLLDSAEWSGVYIEGDEKKFKDLLKTAQNRKINPINRFVEVKGNNSLDNILLETDLETDFELLSIDIDSYDYQVWESLVLFRPKVVVVEINSSVVPPSLQTHRDGKQGSSFQSMLELGNKKGYDLVCHTGNLIFVKKELTENLFENMNSELLFEAWKRIDKKESPVLPEISLTVTITGRNDNHSGDFIKRLKETTIKNVELLKKHFEGSFEYLIVDWGSPNDNFLYLSDEMQWMTKMPEIKTVIVPNETIKAKFGQERFYQFFAKNVGIRKSKGKWILLINADNILNKKLVKEISKAVKMDSDKEFFRTKWWKNSDGKILDCNVGIPSEIGLAATYSGDFLLAKKNSLIEFGRGYDENSSGHQTSLPQAQMDGEILFNMRKNGMIPVIWDLEIYHLDHPRSEKHDSYYNMGGYRNSEDWGLRDNKEVIINENNSLIEKRDVVKVHCKTIVEQRRTPQNKPAVRVTFPNKTPAGMASIMNTPWRS